MASSTDGTPNPYVVSVAEKSLQAILNPYSIGTVPKPSALSETQIRLISDALRDIGKESWSTVPRLYAVLRMVKSVKTIDAFINVGVSDLWFPFSIKTLPESLRNPSIRWEFLELQDFVLTKALDLERDDGKHRHFKTSDDIPLRKLEELGKGGFGYVDRVLSTISCTQYARKLIPRGRNFKKNKEVLRDYERELGHLKKLSHLHIVQLVGSYTDPKFVGILMTPVADSNLKVFLSRSDLSSAERSFLRTFYGCLASALCYLHEQKVRHKDIKPQNVLIKAHQVYLTDFGISLDWSDLGQSTTSGGTGRTERYCAPEVGRGFPCNSLSDLWSLGCVYVEIWTVLKRRTPAELVDYLTSNGSGSSCYYLNYGHVLDWCNRLEALSGTEDENPPLAWIKGCLELDKHNRWSAQNLFDSVMEINDDHEQSYSFCGTCCAEHDDDSTMSGSSSKRNSIDSGDTGVSNIAVYIPKSLQASSLHLRNKDDVVLGSPSHAASSSISTTQRSSSHQVMPHDTPNQDIEGTVKSIIPGLDGAPITSQDIGCSVLPPSLGELNLETQTTMPESEAETPVPVTPSGSTNFTSVRDANLRKLSFQRQSGGVSPGLQHRGNPLGSKIDPSSTQISSGSPSLSHRRSSLDNAKDDAPVHHKMPKISTKRPSRDISQSVNIVDRFPYVLGYAKKTNVAFYSSGGITSLRDHTRHRQHATETNAPVPSTRIPGWGSICLVSMSFKPAYTQFEMMLTTPSRKIPHIIFKVGEDSPWPGVFSLECKHDTRFRLTVRGVRSENDGGKLTNLGEATFSLKYPPDKHRGFKRDWHLTRVYRDLDFLCESLAIGQGRVEISTAFKPKDGKQV